MKKLLIAGLLAAATFVVQAATWTYLGDNAQGTQRLLGQDGSFTLNKNKHGVLVASAIFAFVNENGEIGTPIYVGIDATSCAAGGGEMVMATDPDHVKRKFWAMAGDKIYDGIGKVLCMLAADSAKGGEKATPQKQKKEDFNI